MYDRDITTFASKKAMNGKLPLLQIEGSINLQLCSSACGMPQQHSKAMMYKIFKEEIREGWLVIYMDNLLIATTNNIPFY